MQLLNAVQSGRLCLSSMVSSLQVLQSLTGVVVAHLWEFATDRNASHVARQLLCVIAGRDVTPAQRGGAAAADGAAFIRAAKVPKPSIPLGLRGIPYVV